jgi:ElaB/YqjD/DUF883 family membrane-anchored ribosome-binding protein
MGFCAYNGSPDRLAQLVKVNIWNIDFAVLLKTAQKVIKNHPLTKNDLAELRHQGTNYDALLKSMDVTSEMHKLFQTVATESAVKALKEMVLNTEDPTLLSQYLAIESQHQQLSREIQAIEAQLNRRGQRIAQLNQRLSQQKQARAQRDEELSQLKQIVDALHQQIHQQQQKQAAVFSSQLKPIQQQLWTMLCVGVVCGVVLGFVGTTAMANRPLRTSDAVALPIHIL